MSTLNSNEEWLEALIKTECRDATYRSKNPALVMAKAYGSKIWDVENKEYLDLCAGFGALPLGHNHDSILNNLKAELNKKPSLIMHGLGDVYPTKAKIELLDYLVHLMPDHLTKASLAISGGQAVETAIKTSLLHTGGTGFIAFKEGYHGLDLGVLPVTEREQFKKPFNDIINKTHTTHLEYGCEATLVKEAINKQKSLGIKTAAIIVEPIQGRGGVILPPKGWLKALHDITRETNTLLIFDEIFVGLGRTGKLTHAEEVPCDLLCLGKALGGGMPISALLGREEIMNAWPESQGEALHTGTFFGHPLSCQIGLWTLKEMISANLIERTKEAGNWFKHELRRQLSLYSKEIKEVRGEGFMIAIEFNKAGLGALMMDELRSLGVVVIPSGPKGECLSLTPALNISKNNLEKSIDLLGKAIKNLRK